MWANERTTLRVVAGKQPVQVQGASLSIHP